ncbi:MAG: hypothetical protein WDN08_05460 [Rhizomicrobium sp.]
MKNDPPHSNATEVFAPAKYSEITAARPPGRIDVNDADQVWELAHALRNVQTRRLQAVTTNEVRALAQLAHAGGIALSQGLVLVEMLRGSATPAQIIRQLGVFAAAIGPRGGNSC